MKKWQAKKMNIADSVVNKMLCTGCGFCIPVCPANAIEMTQTSSGIVTAWVDKNQCYGCGECLEICPGIHFFEKNLLEDPFVGSINQAFCAWTTNKKNRQRAQSGGIVSTLLSYLFEKKEISAAMTVIQIGTQIYPQWIKSATDIKKTFGSKYLSVPIGSKFPKKFGPQEKVAVVGLGCQIRGLTNIIAKNKNWDAAVIIKIGLVCDRTLSHFSQDWLIHLSGIPCDAIKSFEFRSKFPNGWPGDVRIISKKNKIIIIDKKERMKIKDALTPVHCRLCFDKLNVTSDIVCGDSYNLSDSKKGKSSVLLRTDMGNFFFNDMIKKGYIKGEKVPAEKIIIGQGINEKKIMWSRMSHSWYKNQHSLPNFGIEMHYQSNAISNQLMNQAESLENALSKLEIFQMIRDFRKIKSKINWLGRLKKYLKWFKIIFK